jgi:succinyl-CoA synthetase alpha subunit/GNAT superfamily N-acetyltransferase
MSVRNLAVMFVPKSVAVLGAKEKQGSVTGSLLRNLLDSGYNGTVFPIHPRKKTILGLTAYPSLDSIGHAVDLVAAVAIPSEVPRLLEECARAGAAGLVVFAPGRGRKDAADLLLLERIRSVAARTGVRLIGPDSQGLLCARSRLNATLVQSKPLPGRIAFIFQSGVVGAAALDMVRSRGLGFSHFVCLGAMSDVDFGDMLDYLAEDLGVDGIALCLERMREPRKFMSAARAASWFKQVVGFKAGRGREDAVWDEVFRRAGIERAYSLEELIDRVGLLSARLDQGAMGGAMGGVEEYVGSECPVLPPDIRLSLDRGKARSLVLRGMRHLDPRLDQGETMELLAAYGIPVDLPVEVRGSEDAVRKARLMGFPVSLEAVLGKATRSKELAGGEVVRSAWKRMADTASRGFGEGTVRCRLRPWYRKTGLRLRLGIRRDSDFGPVILFGSSRKGSALTLPPLDRNLARRLMERSGVYPRLEQGRVASSVDMASLEDVLLKLSLLAEDVAEITELDINPFLVGAKGSMVLGARALLGVPSHPAPAHLVIRPYPCALECRVRTVKGLPLFIRPVRPGDELLVEKLFQSLTPQSVFFRFFSNKGKIIPARLRRMTRVDYDREIVLAALLLPEEEVMVGMVRVELEPDGREGRFAIMVGDPWHGRGVGRELLTHCLAEAKVRRVGKVWSPVLPQNEKMLALGRKLGFDVEKTFDEAYYELSMELREKVFKGA